MVQLNKAGAAFARLPYVKAMTDVTGFGLLGHLGEMCEASHTSAILQWEKTPLMDRAILDHYLDEGCIPGGTHRNWDSYGHTVAPLSERRRHLLCDPQTSGGLLVAVEPGHAEDFCMEAASHGLQLEPFGEMKARGEHLIEVR